MKKLSFTTHIFFFLMIGVQSDLLAQTNEITQSFSIEAIVKKAATCIDSEDGVINVAIKGGQTPYQFIELQSTEKIERSSDGLTFSNLDPDIYTISVVDAEGHKTSTQLELDVVNPEPYADFKVVVKKESLQFINTSDQKDRWEWTFENGMISHKESPIIQLAKEVQQVCLKASNGCNHVDTYCKTVNVKELLASNNGLGSPAEIGTIVPLTKAQDDFSIKVYPNPTIDRLTVHYAEEMQVQSIEVYTVAGRLFQSFSPQTTTQTALSIGSYPTGVYLMQLNGTAATKIFKVNKIE